MTEFNPVFDEMGHWVSNERGATGQVLRCMRKINEERGYLHFADSLFAFCMKRYRYSKHEAQSRCDAMRLMILIPEIENDLDDGRLSLTVAMQVYSAFRQEDRRRKKESRELLTDEQRRYVLADIMGSPTREVDRKLATHFPDQPPPERARPVSATVTHIEFNASNEEMKNYERLQTVYYHRTAGEWGKLFALLAEKEAARLDAPVRRALGINEKSRYIQKSVEQEVWAAWEDGCAWTLSDGERCGSHRNLQSDHIIEYCMGGSRKRENLRLLCGPHNRMRYMQKFDLRIIPTRPSIKK